MIKLSWLQEEITYISTKLPGAADSCQFDSETSWVLPSFTEESALTQILPPQRQQKSGHKVQDTASNCRKPSWEPSCARTTMGWWRHMVKSPGVSLRLPWFLLVSGAPHLWGRSGWGFYLSYTNSSAPVSFLLLICEIYSCACEWFAAETWWCNLSSVLKASLSLSFICVIAPLFLPCSVELVWDGISLQLDGLLK